MYLPEILSGNQTDAAAKLVSRYYTQLFKNGLPRTGSRFETWAGGGDAPRVVNHITADDLVAVSFLSVDIPGSVAVGLLETYRGEISDLLTRIPANLDLADVKPGDFAGVLGEGSPAWELWDLLRGKETGRWGIGATKASKIMARKRPRLIPIYDSVVRPLMGLRDSGEQWQTWHTELSDGRGLPTRLDAIRSQSGVADHASQLRVMDVVLWMHGKNLGHSAESKICRKTV